MKLSDLPNIGSVIEQQLGAVGIGTVEELKAVGAEQAWMRILAMDANTGNGCVGVHESAFGAGGRCAECEKGAASSGAQGGAAGILSEP